MSAACERCGVDRATIPGVPRRGMCGRCYDFAHAHGELDTGGTPRPGFAEQDVSWQAAALCAEVDPEVFFPEKGQAVKPAKDICRHCLVRAECLDYALATRQRHGVWAGLSERERRRLLGLSDDAEEASAA